MMDLHYLVKGSWIITFENIEGKPSETVHLAGPWGILGSEPLDPGTPLGQYVVEGLGQLYGRSLNMSRDDCSIVSLDQEAQTLTVRLTDEFIAQLPTTTG
jgi:hypothetical protein